MIRDGIVALKGNWKAALELSLLPRLLQGLLGAAEWCMVLFLPMERGGIALPLGMAAGLCLVWYMVWMPYAAGCAVLYSRLGSGEAIRLQDAFVYFHSPKQWLRSMGLGLLLGIRRLLCRSLLLLPLIGLVGVPWYLVEYRGWTMPEGVYELVYGAVVVGWMVLAALFGLALEQRDFLCVYFFGLEKNVSLRGCFKRSHRKMKGSLWRLAGLRLFFMLRYLPWIGAMAALGAAPFFPVVSGLLLWIGLGLGIGGIFADVLISPVYQAVLGRLRVELGAPVRVLQATMEFVQPKHTPVTQAGRDTTIFTPGLIPTEGV